MPLINFSPYAHNVLDFIDVKLVSQDGREGTVKRHGMDFAIYIQGELTVRTPSNTQASYVLNQLGCRLKDD